jgi:CubicO group peptidase (beta-lactamase class C family)
MVPEVDWEYAAPAESGWSTELLAEAEAASVSFGSAAVVVVARGRLVAQWGAPIERLPIFSVRKSFLSALIGIEIERGSLALDNTLAQLDIDDVPPALSDAEKKATVADLLKARSGVYHAALYESPQAAALRPARERHPPGTFWYYNNWDFNTLGSIYERAAGVSVFEGFRRDIAEPTGMQDYRVEDGKYYTGAASSHPAYTFQVTARDLARFGLLYLREGRWKGRQIVPVAWVRESTRAHSITPSGDGHGYMWWTSGLDGEAVPHSSIDSGLPRYRYAANGNFSQIVAVMPTLGLVVVHTARPTKTDRPREAYVKLRDAFRLIVAAAPSAGVSSRCIFTADWLL